MWCGLTSSQWFSCQSACHECSLFPHKWNVSEAPISAANCLLEYATKFFSSYRPQGPPLQQPKPTHPLFCQGELRLYLGINLHTDMCLLIFPLPSVPVTQCDVDVGISMYHMPLGASLNTHSTSTHGFSGTMETHPVQTNSARNLLSHWAERNGPTL